MQAGPPHPLLTSLHVPVYNLPFSPYDKNSFYFQKEEGWSKERLKSRITAAKEKLDAFSPDIFITEHFPFGRPLLIYELVPLLKHLRANGTLTLGCAGYPIISQTFDRFCSLADLYDKLCIFTPSLLDTEFLRSYLVSEGKEELWNLHKKCFDYVKNKLTYTGYFSPEKATSHEKSTPVVVSRGGGVVNPHIITKTILACNHLNVPLTAVIGPSSSEKEFAFFSTLTKKYPCILLKEGNIRNLIFNCAVSVSMSGYHTTLETMSAWKPAIYFPSTKRDGTIAVEQGYRAMMMEKLVGSKTAQYFKTSVNELATMIKEQMQTNVPMAKKEWFTGEEQFLFVVKKLFHDHHTS